MFFDDLPKAFAKPEATTKRKASVFCAWLADKLDDAVTNRSLQRVSDIALILRNSADEVAEKLDDSPQQSKTQSSSTRSSSDAQR